METVFHCNDKAFLHHLQRMFAARRDSFIARALLDRSRLLLILVDNPCSSEGLSFEIRLKFIACPLHQPIGKTGRGTCRSINARVQPLLFQITEHMLPVRIHSRFDLGLNQSERLPGLVPLSIALLISASQICRALQSNGEGVGGFVKYGTARNKWEASWPPRNSLIVEKSGVLSMAVANLAYSQAKYLFLLPAGNAKNEPASSPCKFIGSLVARHFPLVSGAQSRKYSIPSCPYTPLPAGRFAAPLGRQPSKWSSQETNSAPHCPGNLQHFDKGWRISDIAQAFVEEAFLHAKQVKRLRVLLKEKMPPSFKRCAAPSQRSASAKYSASSSGSVGNPTARNKSSR